MELTQPMNLLLNQIVSAYESYPGGMETVQLLAEQFNLEPEIVRTLLMAHSATFRVKQAMLESGTTDDIVETPVPDVSDEVFDLVKQSLVMIGTSSQDERLRAKVGMWLWDEKKGRNDQKSVNFGNVNVQVVNNHFAKLREAKAQAREKLAVSLKAQLSVKPEIQDAVEINPAEVEK